MNTKNYSQHILIKKKYITVNLFAVDTVDVDNPLLTVNLDNLALTALQTTANDQDFVVLANRDGAGLIITNKFESV